MAGETDPKAGEGGGNDKPPETPPTGQGQEGAPTPPASSSGTDPTKPGPASGDPSAKPTDDGKGDANKDLNSKTRKSVFAGLHPNRITAIKRQMVEELKPQLLEELKGEADKAAGNYKSQLERLEPKLKTVQDERDTLQERLDAYEGLVNKYLEDRIKDWPKEILETDPRKRNPEADIEDVIAWMDTHEPLARKLKEAPAQPGNGPNQPPAGGGGIPPAEVKKYEENKQAELASTFTL
jgi:hypothetical protein